MEESITCMCVHAFMEKSRLEICRVRGDLQTVMSMSIHVFVDQSIKSMCVACIGMYTYVWRIRVSLNVGRSHAQVRRG